MIKFSLGIITVYMFYYAGNIIYDLFFKISKVQNSDDTEEFTLEDFVDKSIEKPNIIGIEDVENIITPRSFNKNEILSGSNSQEEINIDELRKRFEEEEDIDNSYSLKENTDENLNVLNEEVYRNSYQSEILSQSIFKDNVFDSEDIKWRNLMKLSETSIQLVANYDGQKVYHSTL